MAIDEAGHDKFAAEVCDLALIIGQAGLVAHIDELAVLYHQGRSLGVVFVGRKNVGIFNDYVCSHSYFRFALYAATRLATLSLMLL